MVPPLFGFGRRRILVDIDTQRDLCIADGMMCVRNHRRVLANIRRVMAWARHKDIVTISTELVNEQINGEPRVCMEATPGAQKVSYTLREKRISFPANGSTDLPRDILRRYEQVILQKRSEDPFLEPRLERLLSEVRAEEFIVIGAGTESGVKATVLGLLQRHKKVTVVVDAVGSHDKKQADFALRQMKAKGARLVDTRSVAGVSCLRLVGACGCERCQGLLRKQPVGSSN